MKKFLKEFKEFAMKGNVVDMAVGVVIGAAFGKIVTSLVNDIIMPVVGVITGGTNFSEYKWVIKQGVAQGRFRADHRRLPYHSVLHLPCNQVYKQA